MLCMQIVKARAMLAHELENRAKARPESDHSGTDTSYLSKAAELPSEKTLSVPSHAASSEALPLKTSAAETTVSNVAADIETDKYPVQSTEMKVIDKPVVKEEQIKTTENQPSATGSSVKVADEKFEDDGDDWLKEEESSEVVVSKPGSTVHLGNDEDVSFSDLEDDDEDVPTTYKKTTSGSDSSTKDSREWVQLSRSSADSSKDIKQPAAGSQQISARNPETKESSDWLDFDDIDEV